MKRLSAKTIYALGLILVALIVGAAWQFAISPARAGHQENKDQLLLAEGKISELQGSIASLRAQADAGEQTDEELDRLIEQFPTDFQQQQWIALMYGAARNAGVTVLSLDPGLPADPATVSDAAEGVPLLPSLATIPNAPVAIPGAAPTAPTAPATAPAPIAVSKINMEVRGESGNMVQFLQNLESLGRPLRITSLKLSGEGEVSAEIAGRTYLSRPVSELPAAASPAPAQ